MTKAVRARNWSATHSPRVSLCAIAKNGLECRLSNELFASLALAHVLPGIRTLVVFDFGPTNESGVYVVR